MRRREHAHAGLVLGVVDEAVLELLERAVVHVVVRVAREVHDDDGLSRVAVQDVGRLSSRAVECAVVGDQVLGEGRLALAACGSDDPGDLARVDGAVDHVDDLLLPAFRLAG